MMMKRGHPEYPAAGAGFMFRVFEIKSLHQHREALDEEYSAENRQKELLPDEDGADSYDSSYGEASGIAHEYLGRVGIVPEEAAEGSDEHGHENGHLAGSRNEHDVQILRVQNIAAEPGEDTDDNSDNGRSSGCKSVHSVREIGSVGAGGDDNDYHQHVDCPFAIPSPGTLERREHLVVELVVLDERNGGLGALDHILHFPDAVLDKGFRIHIEGLLRLDLNLLPHHYLVAEADGEAYYETQDYLENELHPLAHSFLVVSEYLDIVVRKAHSPAPEGGEKQELYVDAGQIAEQQHRHDNGEQNDDSAHRRRTLLLHLALEAEVADCLPDLLLLQPAYDSSSREKGYEHGCDTTEHGPE